MDNRAGGIEIRASFPGRQAADAAARDLMAHGLAVPSVYDEGADASEEASVERDELWAFAGAMAGAVLGVLAGVLASAGSARLPASGFVVLLLGAMAGGGLGGLIGGVLSAFRGGPLDATPTSGFLGGEVYLEVRADSHRVPEIREVLQTHAARLSDEFVQDEDGSEEGQGDGCTATAA